MAQEFSQADMRRPATFHDQHGRPWFASVEKSTGDPAGLLQPMFSAPFVPPQTIVRVVAGQPGRVHIHYEDLLEERRSAAEEYTREALRLGRELFGSKFELADLTTLPIEVRSVLGEPPLSYVPIVACMQGRSRWILTGEGSMPTWAVPHFAVKEKPADRLLDAVLYEDDAPEPVAAPARLVGTTSATTRRGRQATAEAQAAGLSAAAAAVIGLDVLDDDDDGRA